MRIRGSILEIPPFDPQKVDLRRAPMFLQTINIPQVHHRDIAPAGMVCYVLHGRQNDSKNEELRMPSKMWEQSGNNIFFYLHLCSTFRVLCNRLEHVTTPTFLRFACNDFQFMVPSWARTADSAQKDRGPTWLSASVGNQLPKFPNKREQVKKKILKTVI